jgi:hypothetical protein
MKKIVYRILYSKCHKNQRHYLVLKGDYRFFALRFRDRDVYQGFGSPERSELGYAGRTSVRNRWNCLQDVCTMIFPSLRHYVDSPRLFINLAGKLSSTTHTLTAWTSIRSNHNGFLINLLISAALRSQCTVWLIMFVFTSCVRLVGNFDKSVLGGSHTAENACKGSNQEKSFEIQYSH